MTVNLTCVWETFFRNPYPAQPATQNQVSEVPFTWRIWSTRYILWCRVGTPGIPRIGGEGGGHGWSDSWNLASWQRMCSVDMATPRERQTFSEAVSWLVPFLLMSLGTTVVTVQKMLMWQCPRIRVHVNLSVDVSYCEFFRCISWKIRCECYKRNACRSFLFRSERSLHVLNSALLLFCSGEWTESERTYLCLIFFSNFQMGEQKCVLNSCCCGCSLRSGSLAIGIVGLVSKQVKRVFA